MPKPRKLLKCQDELGEYFHVCPYCWRYVVRDKGLQQCLKCGGMVDNDNVEEVNRVTKIKLDGKASWRK